MHPIDVTLVILALSTSVALRGIPDNRRLFIAIACGLAFVIGRIG